MQANEVPQYIINKVGFANLEPQNEETLRQRLDEIAGEITIQDLQRLPDEEFEGLKGQVRELSTSIVNEKNYEQQRLIGLVWKEKEKQKEIGREILNYLSSIPEEQRVWSVRILLNIALSHCKLLVNGVEKIFKAIVKKIGKIFNWIFRKIGQFIEFCGELVDAVIDEVLKIGKIVAQGFKAVVLAVYRFFLSRRPLIPLPLYGL